jgi:hypothetical protein
LAGGPGITMLDIVLDHEIGGVSVGYVFSARAGPTPIKPLPDLSTAESTIISPARHCDESAKQGLARIKIWRCVRKVSRIAFCFMTSDNPPE